MNDSTIRDFYFGSNKYVDRYVEMNGNLLCKFQCIELSDGRLPCARTMASVVQKSHKTGKYMWYDDYVAECEAMGEGDRARHYGFHDLQEAYHQFEYIGELEDKRCMRLLLEIIQAYNEEYHSNPSEEKEIPIPDIKFFGTCVIEIQKRGKHSLPVSLKAEFYREAGMFSKCLQFDAADGRNQDEKEIIAEVQYRAIHGDRLPFIIEGCEFNKWKFRAVKRKPCPFSES